MNRILLPPAELWFGNSKQLILQAQRYLQNFFCQNNACTTCKTCSLIIQQQHHATLWLYPEKQYTLESLEPIAQTISLVLEQNQHFFFVIQKADFLSKTCQNMLLKMLEEPPTGYHFLLLAERKEYILPTIQSRCHIKIWKTNAREQINQPLTQFFTQKTHDPFTFLEQLEKNTPHEQESIELLDIIISYWLEQHVKTINTNNNQDTQKKLKLFLQAQQKPPMPGSSKLFWKNLFLQWQEVSK